MKYDRVLFVDDNFFLNMENCEFLRGDGFNVAGVYCASAAVEWLDKHEPLAALVTDIDLGRGADGFEVARHARREHPGLPVVFISGSASARERAANIEGAEFISKPFHCRQLTAALARVLAFEAA